MREREREILKERERDRDRERERKREGGEGGGGGREGGCWREGERERGTAAQEIIRLYRRSKIWQAARAIDIGVAWELQGKAVSSSLPSIRSSSSTAQIGLPLSSPRRVAAMWSRITDMGSPLRRGDSGWEPVSAQAAERASEPATRASQAMLHMRAASF
jgi:hypothetical protein